MNYASVIQINMCIQQMFIVCACDQSLQLYKNKGSSEYFAQSGYSSANTYKCYYFKY